MFDLSYIRHGALLVYDPNHQVLEKITNKQSIIMSSNQEMGEAHQVFAEEIENIAMKDIQHDSRKKRLFLEIASIDGAVVFDENSVLAFGSIIETHPSEQSSFGARTTAALSAYRWGGSPIKISSDGDISIHFISVDDEGNESDGQLNFL